MKHPMLLAIVAVVGLAQSTFATKADVVFLEYKTMSFENCIAATEHMIVQQGGPFNRVLRVIRTDNVWVTKIIADDGNFIITCSEPDQKMLVQMPTPTT